MRRFPSFLKHSFFFGALFFFLLGGFFDSPPTAVLSSFLFAADISFHAKVDLLPPCTRHAFLIGDLLAFGSVIYFLGTNAFLVARLPYVEATSWEHRVRIFCILVFVGCVPAHWVWTYTIAVPFRPCPYNNQFPYYGWT